MLSTPSPSFYSAVSHLNNTSSTLKVGTSTKLELYGLFKYMTVSHGPIAPKPSIFSMEARAKWDAWKAAEKEYGDDRTRAENRYMEIAESMGWKDGTGEAHTKPSVPIAIADEENAEEINWDDDLHPPPTGPNGGMGNSVSAVRAPEPDVADAHTIHGLAIANLDVKLRAFVLESPESLNEPDEFGYTALHLASDRGNTAAVEVLIGKGADKTKPDADGLTALDLARVAGHADIVALLV